MAMWKRRLRLVACTLVLVTGCGEAPLEGSTEHASKSVASKAAGTEVASQDRPWILPQHQQGAVSDILDGFSPDGGNLVFRSGGIDGNTVNFDLVDRASGSVERRLATLSLAEASGAQAGEVTSRSFVMRQSVKEDADFVRKALASAFERVRARDVGGYYIQPAPMREVQEQRPSEHAQSDGSQDERETSVLWVPILVLVLLFGALFVQVRRVTWQEVVSVNVKKTHLLPSVLQLTLLTYWGLHWHEFSTRAHFIAIELAYAYFLEMSLSVLILGHWRLSFGPIPIVLSTNLFVQYTSYEELVMMGIALTVAISSKILIRPGGRHVFNPSALGLAVVGAIWLLLDGSSDLHTWRLMEIPDGDIAHELNLAPNMAELIVLIAVIAHLRVPVVLITISGFMAMIFCGPIYQEMASAPTGRQSYSSWRYSLPIRQPVRRHLADVCSLALRRASSSARSQWLLNRTEFRISTRRLSRFRW